MVNLNEIYGGKEVSITFNNGIYLWYGENSSEYKSYVAKEILPVVFGTPEGVDSKYVYINYANRSFIDEIRLSKGSYNGALFIIDNAEIVVKENILLFKELSGANTVVFIGRNSSVIGLSITDSVFLVDYMYTNKKIQLREGVELI